MNLIEIGISKPSSISGTTVVDATFNNRNSSTGSAVYFAKLSPNIEYSIQKLDANATNTFIVGITAVDLRKQISATLQPEVCKWEAIYVYNDTAPHNFTTPNEELVYYAFIYYTSTSEFSTRVMLNAGTFVNTYEEPSIRSDYYNGLTFSNTMDISIIDMPTLDHEPINNSRAILRVVSSNTIPYLNYLVDSIPIATEPAHSGTPPRMLPRCNPSINNGYLYTPSHINNQLPFGAFSKTHRLISMLVPDNVKTVGKDAFNNTSIKHLYVSTKTNMTKCILPSNTTVQCYDEETSIGGD